MNIAILPDFALMSAVRHQSASFSGVEHCRRAFKYSTEISIRCDSKIIVAEQIMQKLKFIPQQIIALEPFCKFDKTTIGVTGQNHKNCLIETANTWLLNKTIVIDTGSVKLKFKSHPNLRVVSPRKFVETYESAKQLKKQFKDVTLIRIVEFLFFAEKSK
ncbi:hypothetical protein KY360_01730 [Candidatus Woesearchaeota archaeon]|nr:hypothetical protein [Candidatus Woesearchaeota archaeon]